MALLARQTSITCFHLRQSFLLWFPLLLGQQSLPLAVSLAFYWEVSPELTPVPLITPKPSICEFMMSICSLSLCLNVLENQTCTNKSWPHAANLHAFTWTETRWFKWKLLGHLFLSTGMAANGFLRGLASHAWAEWGAIRMEQHPGRGCSCRPIVSGQIPPKLP